MPGESISLTNLFNPELAKGLNIFLGGRETVTYNSLTPAEIAAITKMVKTNARILSKISPKVAAGFEEQLPAFIKWGGVAKGMFPVAKPITYPSQPGTIGVAMIFPQAIIYPSSTQQTGYQANSWDIPVTADQDAFLFGSSSSYYTTSSTNASGSGTGHELMVVAQDGVLEVATSPKSVQEWRITTEIASQYGIYVGEPLEDQTIEDNKTIYQYPTLGQVPIWFDVGTRWKFAPLVSGVSSIRLLGVVYYEHELFPDTTYSA